MTIRKVSETVGNLQELDPWAHCPPYVEEDGEKGKNK